MSAVLNPVWSLKLVRESYPKYQIKGLTDVMDVIKTHIAPKLVESNIERFFFIGMNNRNKIIIIEEHTKGSINSSTVYIPEIAKKLLLCNCNSVIFIHNHPSGQLEFSSCDLTITDRLKNALELFDIRVLDHILVGENTDKFISLAERGAL